MIKKIFRCIMLAVFMISVGAADTDSVLPLIGIMASMVAILVSLAIHGELREDAYEKNTR